MAECTIKKFEMPTSDEELAKQMEFMAKLTEPDTNGFGWPTELMAAKTADEYLEALRVYLAKEDYDLDDLREKGYVPQQYWWIMDEKGNYIGIAKLRYLLTPFLLATSGHIGFGLASEYRGCGYGARGLKLLLDECRKNGLRDALVTVYPNNFPSRRVVEKNGGKFWDIVDFDDKNQVVRYWIDLR